MRFAALFFFATLAGTAARAADAPLVFEKDVRPILKALCFQCHGEEDKPKGKLDVRLVRLLKAGGTSGAAVVPGKPTESALWERIESDEMPEGKKKLTAEQKATIKKWIKQGAKTLSPEPENVADAKYSEVELDHWAFRPVVRGEVPSSKFQIPSSNPIDAFLSVKLAEKGVTGFTPCTIQVPTRAVRTTRTSQSLAPCRFRTPITTANSGPMPALSTRRTAS